MPIISFIRNINIHVRNQHEYQISLDKLDALEHIQNGKEILFLTFPDYIDDPREIHEIKEVRKWFLELLSRQPQWLRYFCIETVIKAELCCNLIYKKEKLNKKENGYTVAITEQWIDICTRAGLDFMTITTDENRLLPHKQNRTY